VRPVFYSGFDSRVLCALQRHMGKLKITFFALHFLSTNCTYINLEKIQLPSKLLMCFIFIIVVIGV
jgi:hypothetical protein